MKSRGGAALFAAGVLLAALAGCGEGSEGGASPTSSSKVKVIDAGAEPREQLRFKVAAGDSQRVLMRMQNTVAMKIDGRAVPSSNTPPMVMEVRLVVANVRPDGIIECSFSYDEIDVEGSGKLADQVEDLLRENLIGVTGSIVSTDTGEYVDGEIDVPDDVDPSLRSMFSSLESQLSTMTASLPVEPVGVGATWRVATDATLNGIQTETVYQFKLVERTESGVALEATTTGSAMDQEPELPGMPAGATVHLDSLELDGTGRTEIDLSRLMPVESASTTTGEIRMSIEVDGSTSTMVQKLRILVGLSPA